jgi:tetratricopeptide (TPR) repeat protein
MKRLFSIGVGAVILLALSSPSAVRGQTVEFFMNNGQELLQRGAYNQAANAFSQALEREPEYFEAQYNLGLTYLQWDKNAQAVIELKKALKLQPKNSVVWSSLAVAYDKMGQNVNAMDALTQAVTYDPSNMTARMNLAAMYANAKKMPQAIVQYREIVKSDSGNIEAMLNLARCLVFTKQVPEAKGYLKQAIVNMPDKGDPHSDLGDLYLKQEHDTARAIVEYQAAIMVEPQVPAYYQQLAWALQCTGRVPEAIDAWKKALIYLDDPAQKEEIQTRIDQLQKSAEPNSPAVSARPSESTLTRRQTEDLEREVRPDSARAEVRLQSAPVDISSDLRQLNADTASLPDFSKDVKPAGGKKAGQQK